MGNLRFVTETYPLCLFWLVKPGKISIRVQMVCLLDGSPNFGSSTLSVCLTDGLPTMSVHLNGRFAY